MIDLSIENIRRLNAKIDVVRNPPVHKDLRLAKLNRSCEVCGYNKVLDNHHDIEDGKEHFLCPNCHALISRKMATLQELLSAGNP